jgi:small GTP-binding protein
MSNEKLSYKMTLIGDSGVGKTSLFKKLFRDTFDHKIVSTIGIDKKTHNFTINTSEGEKEVEVALFDTAGQERFRSISVSYFRESNGLVMVYDITRNETFQNLDNWYNDVKENLGKNGNYLVILLGNKVDLIEENPEQRDVDEQEVKEYCTKNNIFWGGECSAKVFDGEKLRTIFKEFIEEIYKKVGKSNSNVNNKDKKLKKSKEAKKRCC